MTVSRALNNKHLVSKNTYTTIAQAVETLSYVPNHAARTLVSRKNKSIAVLIASVANPYYGRVMEGIESVAEQNGYSVLLINANQQEKYPMCIDSVIGRGVEGFISSHLNLNQKHIDKLLKHNVNCVLIDNEQDIEGISSIESDHRFGASLAVEHLINLGHRKIALIHGKLGTDMKPSCEGREENYSFNLWRTRYESFVDTMRRYGLEVPPEYMVPGDAGFEENVNSGMEAMGRLMDMETPPTAVYAGNDLFAIGALNAVLRRGKKVPEDFSIIGHGGIDATKFTYPMLTSVKQPRFEIGCHAATILIDQISKRGDSAALPVKEIIKPSLVMGNSTAWIS
jgi:DNA-binding LacI/PurR family transcriptional regulator